MIRFYVETRMPLLARIPRWVKYGTARKMRTFCTDPVRILPEFLDKTLHYCIDISQCNVPSVEKQTEILEKYHLLEQTMILDGVERVVWNMIVDGKTAQLARLLTVLSDFYESLSYIKHTIDMYTPDTPLVNPMIL